MSDPKPQELQQLYSKLLSDAAPTHDLWEEIAVYMRPQRLGFQSQYNTGADLTQWMYDSTGLRSAVDWADVVHFALANPFTRWFGVEVKLPPRLGQEKSPAVLEWEQDCSVAMSEELHQSNFVEASNEMILDIGLFGNACPQLEKAPGSRFELDFRSLHIRDAVPLVGGYGVIKTTLYNARMTVQQAIDQFALDEWNRGDMEGVEAILGKKIMQLVKRTKLADTVELLHVVMPRKEMDTAVNTNTGLAEPDKRPFMSVWTHGRHLIRSGGYYEQPRFWPRYRRRTDDTFGGGLGEIALPDTYSLNDMRRLELGAADKEIDPPWLEEGEQFLGDMDTRARGLIQCRDITKVREVKTGGSVAARFAMDELRESVRGIWMADDLALPPREQVGQMTAYEVAKRVERIWQKLGPTIHRITREGFAPMLERQYGLMGREGLLPEMPEELLELKEQGATLDFRFMGASAKAQVGEEVAALDEQFMWLTQAAEMDPAVLDNFDMDKHARKRAELMNYPGDLIRDRRDVEKRRAERAEMEQQAMQAQIAKDAGQALNQTASAVGQQKALELVGGEEAA